MFPLPEGRGAFSLFDKKKDPARSSSARFILLVTFLAVCVTGMRHPHEQSQLMKAAVGASSRSSAGCGSLNTRFFSVDDAVVNVVDGGRPGTTRLTLQLQEGQVSPQMPAVRARLSGVVHSVAKTWT